MNLTKGAWPANSVHDIVVAMKDLAYVAKSVGPIVWRVRFYVFDHHKRWIWAVEYSCGTVKSEEFGSLDINFQKVRAPEMTGQAVKCDYINPRT
jgi:hypothetical protein